MLFDSSFFLSVFGSSRGSVLSSVVRVGGYVTVTWRRWVFILLKQMQPHVPMQRTCSQRLLCEGVHATPRIISPPSRFPTHTHRGLTPLRLISNTLPRLCCASRLSNPNVLFMSVSPPPPLTRWHVCRRTRGMSACEPQRPVRPPCLHQQVLRPATRTASCMFLSIPPSPGAEGREL